MPDVPSAKEVAENGVDLGDNQAVLLRKIEEQMLYILEMDKKIEQLEKEKDLLRSQVEKIDILQKEMQTLKALLQSNTK